MTILPDIFLTDFIQMMERIYKDIGSCGPFQIVHVLLVLMTRFAVVWSVYLMMFGNYNPGWKCSKHGRHSNDSLFPPGQHNGSIYHGSHSQFQRHHDINETNVHFFNNYNTSQTNASVCDFVDYCEVEFDPDSKTIVTEFNLICDKAYVPSVIICIQMIGMLVGAYVFGQIGEWFGRKTSLYGSSLFLSVSSLLAIFSPSWQVYAVFIFFCGAGCSGVMITEGLYIMEFLQPKWRAIVSGIPVWHISLALFAVTIYIFRNWQLLHIATTSITALSCLGGLWTPESLRWLIVHNREKRAEKAVRKIMRMNDKEKDIETVLENLFTTKTAEPSDRKYTYLDLFRSRHISLLTLKLSLMSSFTMIIYFALSFSLQTLAGDFYTNILIAGLSEIPVVLMVGPCANTFGRRPAYGMFLTLTMSGCLAIVISHLALSHDVTARVTTYSALSARATIVGCLILATLFVVELYPTEIRSLAMAFVSMMNKGGSIIAPYLIPKDRNSLMVSYIVMSVALIITFVVVLSLPETKNRPLQDRLTDKTVPVSEEDRETNAQL